MGCSQIISGLKGELARVVKSAHSDTITRKNALTTKALVVLEQYTAEEGTIDRNEALTQQGKAEAKRTYATKETVPALKWMRNVIKDMQDTDQGYRKRFFTITSGIEDPAVRMPTYTYMWSKLDTLDVSERIKQFSDAAEQDQVPLMAAMLENPFGPMVPEDVKERTLTERAKQRFPKQYEDSLQNAMLLEYMTMVRDWIGRWLGVELGVEIKAIRDSLGDEIADQLTTQLVTGFPK